MAKIQMKSIFALSLIRFTYYATAYDAFLALQEISSGESPPVSAEDRAMVEFWIDAGSIDDESRCSIDYLRQLQYRIQIDIRNSQLENVTELYYFTELDLLSACGDRVASLATERLGPLREANKNLRMVVVEFIDWRYDTDQCDTRLFRSMSEWMFLTVGIKNGYSRTEFIRTWTEGPCRTVLDLMRLPEMEPFARFVKLIDETNYDPRKLVTSVSHTLVSLVQCCQYFQNDDALTRAWVFLQSSDLYSRLIERYQQVLNEA